METPRTKIFRMANLLSESRDIIDTMTRERSELLDRVECLALDLDSVQKSSAAKDPLKVDISTETDLVIQDSETNVNNSNITFSVLPSQGDDLSLEGVDHHESKSLNTVSPCNDPKRVNLSNGCRKKFKRRKSHRKNCSKTPDSHWASGDVDRRLSKLLDILEPSNKVEKTSKTKPKSPNHRSRLKKHFMELEKLKKQQREQEEELRQQKRFYNELRAASLGRESGGSSKESEETRKEEVTRSGSCSFGESTLDGVGFDQKPYDKLGDFGKVRGAKGERKSRKHAKNKDLVLNSESLVKNGLMQMHKKRFDEISRNRSGLESAKSLPPDFVAENKKVKSGNKIRYVHFESSQSDVEFSPNLNLKLKTERRSRLNFENSESESKIEEGDYKKDIRDIATTPMMSGNKIRLRYGTGCELPHENIAADSTSDEEPASGSAHRAREKSKPRICKTDKHTKLPIKMDNKKSKLTVNSLPLNKTSERKIKHLSSSSSSSSSRMSDCQSGSSDGDSEGGDAVERFLLEQVKKEQEQLEREITQHRMELDHEKRKLMDFMQESQKNRKHVSEEIRRYLSEIESNLFNDKDKIHNSYSDLETNNAAYSYKNSSNNNATSDEDDEINSKAEKSPADKNSENDANFHNKWISQQENKESQNSKQLSDFVYLSYPVNNSERTQRGRFKVLSAVSGALKAFKVNDKPVSFPALESHSGHCGGEFFLDSLAYSEICKSPSTDRRDRKKSSSFSIWEKM